MSGHAAIRNRRQEILALVGAGLSEQEIIRFTDYTPTHIKEALAHEFLSWRTVIKAKRARSIAMFALNGWDPVVIARIHGVSRKTASKDLAELADRIMIIRQLPMMKDRLTEHPLDLTHFHAIDHVRSCLNEQCCWPFKRGISHGEISTQIRLAMLESGLRYSKEKPRLRSVKAL